MELIRDPRAFRARCDETRAIGKTVALVPTMGALHEGHLKLVDEARKRADVVAVSIFVNPTQFGPTEDFKRYPRDLERDMALLASRGADLVFAPEVEAVYPEGHKTEVRVRDLTGHLCGAHRPVHFGGVATVVSILFNLTGPCAAVFGRKDYQQLKVIERMARDLHFPVLVVGVPTVREPDGLAMSSRNAYLSAEERKKASTVPASLVAVREARDTGERRPAMLQEIVRSALAPVADRIDYAGLYHPEDLYPLDGEEPWEGRALLAVALFIGKTRLIDNTVLGELDPTL